MALPQIDLLLSGFGTDYSGGKAYAYYVGTTTLAPWYEDAAGTILAANPFTLDANGRATLYSGARLRLDVQNAAGVSVPGFPINNLQFGVEGGFGGGFSAEQWIFRDATSAPQTVTLLQANDPLAQKTIVAKTDATANAVNITPTAPSTLLGGITSTALTTQGETMTLVPNATDNVWYAVR